MKIIVIGSGIMAGGIAAGFLAAGAQVVVLGRSKERLSASRDSAIAMVASLAPADAPADASTASRIGTALLDEFDRWEATDLVIETITEDLALKQALFAWLDGQVPLGIPIGSNSSSYPISRIAAGCATARRMFGTHYFMPAHVVPLVEVVLGERSDPVLAEQVCASFAAGGKRPVLVRKDIPGFLANRIQHALMREALALIDQGIATAEDVDVAVRYSFGFRYAAVGPIMQKEISGWDTMLAAAREIYPSLSNTATVPAVLAERVAAGNIGMKSGEGFIRWTPQRAAAVRQAYERKLKKAFELLGDDAPQ